MKILHIISFAITTLELVVANVSFEIPKLRLFNSTNQKQNSDDDQAIVPNIINGVQPDSGEFGFAAQVFYKYQGQYQFVCGGALISDSYVVTAGHCVIINGVLSAPSDMMVIVGSSILRNPNAPGASYYSVVKVNPGDYASNRAHDVALLKLATPVPSSVATPVKVYPYRMDPGMQAQVAGWGVYNMNIPMPSMNLLKTTVDISSSSNCTLYNGNWKSNFGPLLCQENYNGNDSCQGDSGGPLVMTINGIQALVGITSKGGNKDPYATNLCGYNTIAYYSRTAFFLRFIADELGVKMRDLAVPMDMLTD
ncbi:Chymotrypsinogen B [Zancudomyces culisetae]|uniref:Chymotrypsinogen B n=1 Tax=Zancudomyces culisetae TaxID=1213189 RepID=A0A1R1PD46_ZANCU|nr:Chymotrypsinogen B [Zancudomyces culisetae]|eukprot:OMH78887.1 Chymotrypsinogen B [Zancudomyces culisetae]